MTHIVTEACVQCKFTDCASACPVDDCFIEGPNFLAIDPEACIDCGVCIDECPVDAIKFEEDDFPDKEFWKQKNAELAEKWGPENGINEAKDPHPQAEEYREVGDKKHLLIEEL